MFQHARLFLKTLSNSETSIRHFVNYTLYFNWTFFLTCSSPATLTFSPAAGATTLVLTPGTGFPAVPTLQYLLGMLAVSSPQLSGRPTLS